VDIGVLHKDYASEWASLFTPFTIPKKNGKIRVVTNFKELNLLLKRIMSPISYSKDWIMGNNRFNQRVYLVLDLNMDYYHNMTRF
jgi:hypothetical protein